MEEQAASMIEKTARMVKKYASMIEKLQAWHLQIFLPWFPPNMIEKALIWTSQIADFSLYFGIYLKSPKGEFKCNIKYK